MSELPWFKFYTEALSDPKFAVVANDNKMQTWEVLGIWTSLLCVAANSPIRGTLAISELRGLSIKDLKSIIRWDDSYWDNTDFQDFYDFESIIKSFMELDMIILDECGTYKIKNFDERQETKEDKTARLNRERQKRFQNSHKDEDSVINNVINNDDITHSSVSVSSSDSISLSDSDSDSLTKPNIFKIYENTIGIITGPIADKLRLAEKEYPELWISRSFEISAEQNKRSWAYVYAILERWRNNGYDGDKKNGHSKKPVDIHATEDGRNKYGEWETR